MAELTEYKCPRCGGSLSFDGRTGKMVCAFCDSTFDPAEFQGQDESLGEGKDEDIELLEDGFMSNVSNTWADGETDGLFTYLCKSCGGEIVGDETTASVSCPFCGNPVVIMGAFSGNLKPDYIIPFKLDKKQAEEALSKHLKGKVLLPKVFRQDNKIKEIKEIKGLYVPFWLFNSDTFGDYEYSTKKIRRWSDDDYDYKETSHYHVRRSGRLNFRGLPVDSSKKADSTMMESIEPYDYRDAIDFKTAYLAGYFADKFDVDTETCWNRAKSRMINTSDSYYRSTVKGYDEVSQTSGEVEFFEKQAKYALLPVWMLSTSWKGKIFTFAMNGQTGKFVGNLPMDVNKFILWFLGLFLGAGGLAFLISIFI